MIDRVPIEPEFTDEQLVRMAERATVEAEFVQWLRNTAAMNRRHALEAGSQAAQLAATVLDAVADSVVEKKYRPTPEAPPSATG